MTSTSSGLTMLTSGVSQYLHPDYLQPLPTTLDAKKSPLALLAQTCSAIGKDTSPSKPIIPPLERKEVDKQDKVGDSDSVKRPSSHGHKDSGRDSKPGFRAFPPKEIPPLVPIMNSNGLDKSVRISSAESKPMSSPNSAHSMNTSSCSSSSSGSRPISAGAHSGGQRSSSRSSNGKGENPGPDHMSSHHNGPSHHHHHHQHSSHRHRDSPASSSSGALPTHTSSSPPCYSKPPNSHSSSSSSVMQSSPSLSSSSALKPSSVSHHSVLSGLPSTTAAHLAGYANPLALMGHGLDPSGSSAYHSALAAHTSLSNYAAAAAAAQSSAMKAAAGATAALSPFVTYARVRTPSGATTLVPVCRDPYCTNCQLTLQNSHLSATCNSPGCAQCAHEKSLTSLSTLGLPSGAAASSMLLPSLSSAGSLSSSMSALSSLHSLYPHSALAAAAAHAAHQGLPYLCSWVSGNDYCGKRFSSSEELLQHLRTHTSSMDMSALAAASYAGLGGLPPSALTAYPHLSAPLSPNSLRRTYPTSLSPVSSLLSASRYHPYKSPLSGVGAAPPAPQPFPGVGPYYSPYTLYGQRLGAAVVP